MSSRTPVPRYELSRVYEDHTEAPQIVPVTAVPWDAHMGRRDSLGVGVGAAAALLLLGERRAAGQGAARVVHAHLDLVTSLAITPDGGALISGGRDRWVKVWSLPEGELQWSTLRSTSDPGIGQLVVTPDGSLAVGSQGTSHFVLSVRDRRYLGTLSNPLGSSSPARSIAMSPDGGTVAIDSNLEIRLWSPAARGQPRVMTGHTGAIQALAFLPDGRLVSGAADGAIRVWSAADRRLLLTMTGHGPTVAALAASRDGNTLLSGSLDGRLVAWSLPASRMTATLAGDHLPTPDARSLMFWSTENDRVIAPLPMLEWSTVGSRILALTPDGSTAAFCADGRTLRVWSVGEARETANVGGGKRRIHGLLATPDGATLVVWLGDGSIELRSLPGGELQATLSAPTRVHVAAVTPDGLTLVTGHPGGVIALWDLEKREARGYLFDPAANQGEGLIYSQFDANTGRTLTYTLPCGSPIPSGATCTCNCVPGRYRPEPPSQPPSGGGGGGGGGCICNTICTCIPVFR